MEGLGCNELGKNGARNARALARINPIMIIWYFDAFPAVPASQDAPAQLKGNAGKMIVDASPMYLDYDHQEIAIPERVAESLPKALS